ncbi:hypothetical protein I6J39_17010 [Streptomyces californicus]|uniref:Uncharacterized protein n=1 Tax=Streptomyces californicus TaxID=67351 RepID=A0ABX7J3B2_9ACTN|nr:MULTISPECIES: hypothetical protein [Streptomyces]QRV28821.1 hypothetical protein I6J39_17010 [Streptomyces californicus]QRV42235.1 hypothetical protein I6J41_16925 [Streptomyces californicus]
MAFPEDPLGLRAELRIGTTWVDVTKRAYTRDPIRTVAGMSAQGTGVDPASLSLTLNNKDGVFSPRNPLSPYYGKLGRNTPVRISVPGGETYLSLDGAPGARAVTAGTGLPAGSTDLDLRVELTPETWSPADATELLSRWDPAPGRSWVLVVQAKTGRLQVNWSPNGTDSSGAVSPALELQPGERAAARVTLDVDNGSGSHVITWYKAPTLAGPWTQLGSPTVRSGTTSTYASSTPLSIGDIPTTSWIGMPGRVHGAEIRAGIGGPVAAKVDWATAPAGATSHTDATGRVWALEGDAKITTQEPIGVGEIASWPSRWAPSGQDAWVPVEGAGILRRMQQGRKALNSTLRRRIPSGAPVAYWPMEEGDSATQAYSPVPRCAPLVAPGLDWASADTLPGSSPLPTITAGATLKASVPAYPASTSWQLEFVYFRAVEPTLLMPILELATGVSPWPRLSVRIGPGGGVTIMGTSADGESSSALLTGGSGPVAGQWNRFRLTLTQDGTLVRISVLILPIGGSGGVWNQSFTGTVGPLRGISGSYTSVLEATAIGHLSVFSSTGVQVMDYADHGYNRETAGARAVRLATEEGVQLAVLGDPADSALMGPQRPQTLVELLHECAEADGGILMERPDALGLVYRTRASLYNQSPKLVLPYGAIAPSLEPVEDDQAVRNDVTASRRGGGSGRAVVETGPLSVLPSEQGGVGVYDESVELNLADDAQAQPMASWLAHLGTVDEARYPSIKVNLHKHPELIPAALRLRIGDLVRLTGLPLWVGESTTDLHVMQIQHEPRPRAWTVTLVCTPASPYRVGVVGDTVHGRVDTSGTVLAAPVTEGATAWPITVTAGRAWITTAEYPSDFPFDVKAGGEVATCTAITGQAEDDFTGRTVSAGWGTAPSGQPWTLLGGVPGDYAVSGGVGQHSMTPRDTIRHTLASASAADQDLRFDWSLNSLPVGDSAYIFPMVRASGATSMYFGRVQVAASGAMTLTLRKRVGGETQLGSAYATGLTYAPGAWYTVRLSIIGSTLAMKMWLRGTAEPTGWQLSVTDSDLTAPGSVGCRSLLGSAATTASLTASFDNLHCGPQQMTVARAVNGIRKGHSSGTDVRLAHPTIVAL